MTPRFTARQSNIRLIGLFLSVAVLALVFQFYRANLHHDAGSGEISQAETMPSSLFIGVRHASAKEIRAALPEANGRPTVLEFGSRLCHDCQRLAPVVSKLAARYPAVYFRNIDVLEDHDKAPAILRTFKPVSVPLLVFIDAQGDIRNVLYDYQSPAAVSAALDKLQAPVAAPLKTKKS
jgi:thiol:disulfide interchange protein